MALKSTSLSAKRNSEPFEHPALDDRGDEEFYLELMANSKPNPEATISTSDLLDDIPDEDD